VELVDRGDKSLEKGVGRGGYHGFRRLSLKYLREAGKGLWSARGGFGRRERGVKGSSDPYTAWGFDVGKLIGRRFRSTYRRGSE